MTTVADRFEREQPSALLQAIDQLLRDAPGVLARIREGQDLATLAKAMMLTVAAGAGVFGAALGTYRGGAQILYAGLKLPMVMLLTMAICAPALTALNRAVGRPGSMRRDVALVLSALARTSLVLAAEAPIVLLAIRAEASYHATILLVVGCCALAGAVGLVLFARGLLATGGSGTWTVGVALLAVFALVGAQASWTLRPYLVRPRTPEVVLVRALEGSFVEAVATSIQSARGVYVRPWAPLPGESSSGEEER